MADIVRTIHPTDPEADYSSPTAWEAALTADSPDNQIGVMTSPTVYTGKIIGNVSNAHANEPWIVLTGIQGEYTAGYFDGVFDGGAVIQGLATATGYAAEIYSKNFALRGFSLKLQQQVNGYLLWTNSSRIALQNMALDGRAGCQQDMLQLTGGADGHILEGNIIAGKCVTAGDYLVQLTGAYAHNILANTMLGVDGCTCAGVFYQHPNSTGKVKNNLCLAHTGATLSVGCFSGSYTLADVDHNVSSDATATGTNTKTNQTTADWLENIDAGTEDLHTLKGQERGVNLTGVTELTYDIDAQGRPDSAWTLGADEVVPDADRKGHERGFLWSPRRWPHAPSSLPHPLLEF